MKVQWIQETLRNHPEYVDDVEAVLKQRLAGSPDPKEKKLPRGIARCVDVPHYLARQVLSSLTGTPEDVFENMANNKDEVQKLWVFASGGDPRYKLPAREMPQ
eukprot:5055751-Lingulodinium_polyedra.AAC.1